MSRLPFEQMIAILRPVPTSESKLGTMAGAASVLVMSVVFFRWSVRKPSSLTWISWPLSVVTGIASFLLYLAGVALVLVVLAEAGILPTMDMCVGTGIERPGSRMFQ